MWKVVGDRQWLIMCYHHVGYCAIVRVITGGAWGDQEVWEVWEVADTKVSCLHGRARTNLCLGRN
jgi:hypothetical protein